MPQTCWLVPARGAVREGSRARVVIDVQLTRGRSLLFDTTDRVPCVVPEAEGAAGGLTADDVSGSVVVAELPGGLAGPAIEERDRRLRAVRVVVDDVTRKHIRGLIGRAHVGGLDP